MTVVVDASLLVVLVNRDPRREVVRQQFHTWITHEYRARFPGSFSPSLNLFMLFQYLVAESVYLHSNVQLKKVEGSYAEGTPEINLGDSIRTPCASLQVISYKSFFSLKKFSFLCFSSE